MDKNPIKKCPHCGNIDSYSFMDYGHVIKYTGQFGGGRGQEECSELNSNSKPPVYAKCDKCGKRIKLTILRGEN